MTWRRLSITKSTTVRGLSYKETNESHSFCVPGYSSHHRGAPATPMYPTTTMPMKPCWQSWPIQWQIRHRSSRMGGGLVRPRGTNCGTGFYPGGKVEHAAYTPLLRTCAEQGILCVLIYMLCNWRCSTSTVRTASGSSSRMRSAGT